MKHTEYTEAVNKGLEFIADQQVKNGGFESFWSQGQTTFDVSTPRYTTFFPSLILNSVSEIDNAIAKQIKQKIITYLLSQKSKNWSFNYWERDSKMYIERPLPDDLDDTFCALTAIYRNQPDLLTGDVMASIAHVLFSLELKEGGPYRTWLASDKADKAWKDIDLAVNANIAYFLSLQDIELPHLTELFEEKIKEKDLASIYYPDIYPIAYFIARVYNGAMQTDINNYILKLEGRNFWGSPHNAALCLSALINNNYPINKLKRVQQFLLNTQHKDGSWPAGELCIDSRQEDVQICAGADSLTTALCLEALTLYRKFEVDGKTKKPDSAEIYYKEVKSEAINTINAIKSLDLKDSVQTIFERIINRDNDRQIILLPFLVSQSISAKIDKKTLQKMSLISLWGWMAYTIYDDFLDGEGDRKLLPGANYCLRYLDYAINDSLNNKQFRIEATEILNKQEAANVWEIENCRVEINNGTINLKKLPDYKDHWQLADRSLGHTIAALGVLYAAGYKYNSITVKSVRSFFKHYLIARQLNDDAHDWEEDLRTGHINAVAVQILNKYKLKKVGKVNITHELDGMRKIMWEEVILDVCDLIEVHLGEARKTLAIEGVNLKSDLLLTLLNPVEKAVSSSRTRRKEALDFIASI